MHRVIALVVFFLFVSAVVTLIPDLSKVQDGISANCPFAGFDGPQCLNTKKSFTVSPEDIKTLIPGFTYSRGTQKIQEYGDYASVFKPFNSTHEPLNVIVSQLLHESAEQVFTKNYMQGRSVITSRRIYPILESYCTQQSSIY
jgi:hypothetical protein